MVLLAIDTSTHVGSLALRGETGLIGCLSVGINLTHSEGLMPALDALLRQTRCQVDDLSAVAVISGPGSYTGLRIGIATAQGLAAAKGLPSIAISSLDVLAHVFPHAACPVCPMLTARKGWVYARIYRWGNAGPTAVTEAMNCQPEDLISHIHEPTLFFGPGLSEPFDMLRDVLQDEFISVDSLYNMPRADLLAALAAQRLSRGEGGHPSRLQPIYLGPSQAEINWKKRESTV
jgi:tRNA threonylcarbamoyladenosine biosynthesis protein TsaB